MDRSSSLEKEKKNITHFLPKALIEEINKSCDDKNHNKPSFPLKEKEINTKPNPNININTSINGIHNGFSFNNKNMNFLNSSYQNINISNISYNKLNMNNIHSQSIINNNTNHNTINLNHSQNISGKALNSNINNNMQKYLNDINKINGINGIKNGINGLNGNNIFKKNE